VEEKPVRIRRALVTGGAALALVLGPAATAGAAPGGCQAFGQNVAFLGSTLGPDFGATASSVARIAPGAFPALVVRPEQEAFCA
jgi:hypothetical protein